MIITLPVWLRAEFAERFTLALNVAPDPDYCRILIYTAPLPAGLAAITSQTLLAVYSLADPAAVRTDNVIALQPGAAVQAIATGDAVFGRVVNASGAVLTDLEAGLEGSGKPLILSHIGLLEGGFVTMLSGTLTG